VLLTAESANRLIQALAAAFHGEVTLRMGPISPYPEMVFYHTRHQVFVDLVNHLNGMRVTLTFQCDPPPGQPLFDLHLFRPRNLDWFWNLVRKPDPRRAESLQPGALRLYTSEPQRLKRYFSEGTCFRLRELTGMERPGELAVAWTPGRFLLQKPVSVFDFDRIHRLVNLSLSLIESLRDGGVLGAPAVVSGEADPVILTTGVVWDPVVGTCQVCGEKLEGKVVYCASCSTPHHPDCWEYLDRCSVYACGGKRASERMRR
jgi:hypothetical protein